MVMEVVHEDVGDCSMQCTDHPYKNSTPGGICAFCLQEKLGKLVSSSFSVAIYPSYSSSSSPSFRSDFGGCGGTINTNTATTALSSNLAAILPPHHNASSSASSSATSHHINLSNDCEYYTSRRSKMPFLLSTHRRKKNKDGSVGVFGATTSSDAAAGIVFKRSKSTTTPRRGAMHFLDADAEDYSPHKKGFWSFLYLSKHSTTKKGERPSKDATSSYASSVSSAGGVGVGGSMRSREKKKEELVVVDENESPDQAALDRKVSRSRSVGCGSRSFSGDFFERISTGFGDCTLRRVESQREGKAKVASMHRNSGAGQDCIKERVKCGGIFSGFMITSSSSSSSSSSYWVSSSTEDNGNGGRSASTPGSVRHLVHGRSKSWGWAFASPMRAFGKPSNNGKREASNKNATPNLAAIPSLLAVR